MQYDITLKDLFQTPPAAVLRQLTGREMAELLTVELPTVQMRRPDFLARLSDGSLYHLELQSDNDDGIAWRMLEYYLLLHRLYGQPPLQQVLYVGPGALNMASGITQPLLSYRFALIDVRTLRPEDLLTSAQIEDNIFAILCSRGHEREVAREILQRLTALDANRQQDFFLKLYTLSKLRDAGTTVNEEAERMPVVINLRHDEVLGKYFDEAERAGLARGLEQGLQQGLQRGLEQGLQRGLEQGVRRGLEQGLRRSLRRQLEKRFGLLPSVTVDKIEAASVATLEIWLERVLDAASVEEVLAPAPGELPVA